MQTIPQTCSRRRFLRGGLGAAGLALAHPLLRQGQLLAQEGGGTKKLLFLFQRGGNDGINTVIPRGDADYSEENRPSLFIPENQAIDLGNGFAQLHPRLQPMMEIFQRQDLTGQAGPGNLAIVHRVGYANQSRSHFDSQDFWENGAPGETALREGLFYRHLAQRLNLEDPANGFSGAALSGRGMLALRGRAPLPSFSSVEDFDFPGDAAARRKFLGELPGPETAGRGMRGLYGGEPSLPGRRYSELVHRTGQAVGASVEMLRAAIGSGYVPSNGAEYPDGSFGRKLMEAAMLLKRTPAQVVGVNLDGWDTHAGQGQINGAQGDLLEELAAGFRALYRDLQDQWGDIVLVTMTEFGRTSKENGGGGTDHAESSVMFVAGGGVRGGVYNCDAATWKTGDMFSQRERYLARRTDFRSVFGEIFLGHFGDGREQLDVIMPGYSEAVEDDPGRFRSLGLFG